MKVILLADVKSVGKKGETVTVADGYGRNVLLAKKLGVEATAQNMNNLKLQKANEEKLAKEQYEAAVAFGEELKTKQIVVTIKTGEGGKIFGSITSKDIADALKEQHKIDVDKKKIQLGTPIKNVGEMNVDIKLYTEVSASLKVIVEAKQ